MFSFYVKIQKTAVLLKCRLCEICDCQLGDPGFDYIPRSLRGQNFLQPSFATPSVDMDDKPFGIVSRQFYQFQAI